MLVGKADGDPAKYDANSGKRDWSRGGGQDRLTNVADGALLRCLGDDLETLFEVRCVPSDETTTVLCQRRPTCVRQ